ncbi:superoxide dismutase family protein [Chondromyces apiculatus]|uniref:Superoxide dismutase [Cu-Zn] n=1 Tax=Chondromyces apiculatus DSM 436 TaxID=1192034 RepID=A0A017SX83_9BACT|nr:superoxide dismutase family protein [Chondromyces apiculatus]EYF01392.1 Copper/zinc superoxide dismutase [Chondromyces apiculatus DSM 436]
MRGSLKCLGAGLSALLLVVGTAACDDDGDGGSGGSGGSGGDGGGGSSGVSSASAEIGALEASGVSGTAMFSLSGAEVTVVVTLMGAPPGEHGLHIHQNGVCDGDGTSAGDHWNPEMHEHGQPGEEMSHLGDLGNITIGADGNGSLTYRSTQWTLGDGAATDVIGHAIILHAAPDDFGQPSGNAGARIGCGVIK